MFNHNDLTVKDNFNEMFIIIVFRPLKIRYLKIIDY